MCRSEHDAKLHQSQKPQPTSPAASVGDWFLFVTQDYPRHCSDEHGSSPEHFTSVHCAQCQQCPIAHTPGAHTWIDIITNVSPYHQLLTKGWSLISTSSSPVPRKLMICQSPVYRCYPRTRDNKRHRIGIITLPSGLLSPQMTEITHFSRLASRCRPVSVWAPLASTA